MTGAGISVVIPVYNDNDRLERCITSFLNGTVKPLEIIVIDDGSDFAPIYEHQLVRVISQPNQGPAAARNKGAEAASSDFLYFTDADCWSEKDTLFKLQKFLSQNPKSPGIAGPYKLNVSKDFISTYSDIDLLSRYGNILNKQVFVHGTYNLLLKKSLFESINGFDISFPRASGEDFDLVARYTGKFGGLDYLPELQVNTEHEAKLFKYLKKQYFRGFDRIFFYQKNPPKKIQDYYTSALDPLSGISLFCLMITPLIPVAIVFPIIDVIFFHKKIRKFSVNYRKISYTEGFTFYLFNLIRFQFISLGFFMGAASKLLSKKYDK
jgi:glycosyltransferase involved in cell wall biosynthesis